MNKEIFRLPTLRSWKIWTRQKPTLEDSMQKKYQRRKRVNSLHSQSQTERHVERRVQLDVSKEETFPNPLKHIDVTRPAHTIVDVLQERGVDDYWHANVGESLSDSWTGFTKFTLLEEKHPKGSLWSRKRLTIIQATTRPGNLWPEVRCVLGVDGHM